MIAGVAHPTAALGDSPTSIVERLDRLHSQMISIDVPWLTEEDWLRQRPNKDVLLARSVPSRSRSALVLITGPLFRAHLTAGPGIRNSDPDSEAYVRFDRPGPIENFVKYARLVIEDLAEFDEVFLQVGHEVNIACGLFPQLMAQLATFLSAIRVGLADLGERVRLGTSVSLTEFGGENLPPIIDLVAPVCDWIGVTYNVWPSGIGLMGVRSTATAAGFTAGRSDIDRMLETCSLLVGNLPILLTQTALSGASKLGSSVELQSIFVDELFDAARAHRGLLAILWAHMGDHELVQSRLLTHLMGYRIGGLQSSPVLREWISNCGLYTVNGELKQPGATWAKRAAE